MSSQNFERRVRPAIVGVFAGDGAYRCERDLHHHLTVLLNGVSPLRVGQRDTVIEYEHPTTAKYRWTGEGSKSGNVDLFFFSRPEADDFSTLEGGLAIEVNYDYPSLTKIEQDICKLIDPANAFGESVYVAFGRAPEFKRRVNDGLARAFAAEAASDASFQLRTELHVFIIEEYGGRRTLWEISGTGVDKAEALQQAQLDARVTLSGAAPHLDPTAMLSREQARIAIRQAMEHADIPLESITARCMFERTTTRDGRNECRFGRTPLWEYEVRKVDDSVAGDELARWIERLCK